MSGDVNYRGMDKTALDAAYNNSAATAGSAAIVADWEARSEEARGAVGVTLDIRYGSKPRHGFDYFQSGRHGAPLFAFLHGGYWQRNSKETFSFIAAGPNHHGIDVASIGYTLAPEATLTEIVAEINVAFGELIGRARSLGFDPSRVIVGGWSAGGHLAAMAARLPQIAAAMPISGIFDLEPIRHTYINDAVRITTAEVEALSPQYLIEPGSKPYLVAVGGAELPELRRQSQEFAAALNEAGHPAELLMPDGENHFSVMETLADPDGALCKGLVRLAGQICSGKRR